MWWLLVLESLRSSNIVKIGLAVGAFAILCACGGGSSTEQTTNATATARAAAGEASAAQPHAAAEFGGAKLPKGHELLALQQNCQVCHSLDMVYTQRLSKATWTAEVTKMMKFGAPLAAGDKTAVIAYLAKYLGPSVRRSPDRATAIAPVTTYSSAPAQ